MRSKKIIISVVVVLILIISGYYAKVKYLDPKRRIAEWEDKTKELVTKEVFKEGDIIFQSSSSRQTRAIQLATHSEWSHVGIVLKKNGDFYVYEAVQPVKFTPLALWLSKSKNGIFAVKRLINSDSILNESSLQRIKYSSEKFLGKDYDIYFGWSDEKIYCSEYVWKIYKEALDIEVGKLQKLKEFDLNDSEVKKIMDERYGNSPPLDENVISPVSIYNSDNLMQVYP
jgi:hypothetical protein